MIDDKIPHSQNFLQVRELCEVINLDGNQEVMK